MIAEAFERAVRARLGQGAMSALSLSQLCEACADATSLKASIVLVTEEGRHQAASAASGGAAAVEELQFTLGEGPGVDAHAEGRPSWRTTSPCTRRAGWRGWHHRPLDHAAQLHA